MTTCACGDPIPKPARGRTPDFCRDCTKAKQIERQRRRDAAKPGKAKRPALRFVRVTRSPAGKPYSANKVAVMPVHAITDESVGDLGDRYWETPCCLKPLFPKRCRVVAGPPTCGACLERTA